MFQKCSYITKMKTKISENVLARLKQPSIPAGESFQWDNGAFTIPALPPSHLEKCNIINIQYFIQVSVISSTYSISYRLV